MNSKEIKFGNTRAFDELTRNVKKRFYKEIPLETGRGFRLDFQDDVPLEMRPFIRPGVFV